MKWLFCSVAIIIAVVVLRPQQEPFPLVPVQVFPQTTAYEAAVVYAGPSDTYKQLSKLNPGLPITITERNHTGMWVHIARKIEDGSVVQDGWVLSAFLNRDASLHFGDLPINTFLADADPTTVNSKSLASLYAVPIIPAISDTMVKVFQQGQQLGNFNNVITKVGDSLVADVQYLTPMSNSRRELGPYDYLTDTVKYYGASMSMATDSVAARLGMSTYGIFDPFWADKTKCKPAEVPLDCEYRIKKPSIAFIMFGPNDVRSMTEDKYAGQMRQIIEDSLKQGVIPVISTFSAHPDEEYFWQSINFNLQLVSLAQEYQIPLINLWSAARVLPEYG
ncbi:MAG: hypothetical protein H0X30_39790, partial [Anaerolineae bacterium]|nr:hypothetical protein [Anaerolineae bacterium]